MSKKTALYLMIAGAALTIYDMTGDAAEKAAGGRLYGAGKPLEGMRWNVYTSKPTGAPEKPYYLSISDVAAVAGAWFYYR